MILHVLRALFVLLISAVGYFYATQTGMWGEATWLAMMVALVVGVLVVCIDILSPRKKLAVISGTFFGLIVGILIAYALSFVVNLVLEQIIVPRLDPANIDINASQRETIARYINYLIGVTTSYLAISFILQTKDDFRFVIPYVEFAKQTKGNQPILLDTSALIDGRINDIAATGIFQSQLIVPRFVLRELQTISDSADKLKRARGRRGLDVVAKLQDNDKVDVMVYDSSASDAPGQKDVDQLLMDLAQHLSARVVTADFNLNKVAQLRGVPVLNLNDLTEALRPVVLPGERMNVRLLKPGEEAGQGVGYLDDGTMVVVEHGRPHLNEEVEFTVTSVLQTSAGRMIFGRLGSADSPPRTGSRSRGRSESTSPSN
jgi:uncharacterized protein YacL